MNRKTKAPGIRDMRMTRLLTAFTTGMDEAIKGTALTLDQKRQNLLAVCLPIPTIATAFNHQQLVEISRKLTGGIQGTFEHEADWKTFHDGNEAFKTITKALRDVGGDPLTDEVPALLPAPNGGLGEPSTASAATPAMPGQPHQHTSAK